MLNQNLYAFFYELQKKIAQQIEGIENKKILIDEWQKPQISDGINGNGCTMVLENGGIFERAAIGFSCVSGSKLPPSASNTKERQNLAQKPFKAIGVSIIIHPFNPFIPTVHFNIRSLQVYDENNNLIDWWFGGGMDLTPYYGFAEDCIHFHQTCKNSLDPFGIDLYPKFKQQCDEYFYLPHRQEARGIGGIFFDNFNQLGFEQSFSMTQSIGNSFCQAYLPIVEKRKDIIFNNKQKHFQHLRRGRYVEFNLVFDRGTLFGLQSKGRTESILTSMPPCVKWEYDFKPEPNSLEHKLYTDFLPAKNWLGYN